MNIDLIIRAIISAFIIVSSPLVLVGIKKLVDKVKDDKLRELVLTFVEAADQMLKQVDPTGEQRKQYVLNSLKEMGVENNTYVNALIEQAVLGLWYYKPTVEEKEV